MKCIICDDEPMGVRWTDTHGIAACLMCNTPYRIYHYENDKRVDKPATCLVSEEWVPFTREFWEERRRKIPHNLNMPGSSYEICTQKDFEFWNNWCDENNERLPTTGR